MSKKNIKKNIEINKKNLSEKSITNSVQKTKKGDIKNLTFFDKLTKHPLLIILAFASLLYVQTLFFDFVNFDDNKIKNEVLTTIGGISHITKVMTMAYGNFFRPLQTGLFLIERQIGGESAFIFHLTNLLLHALNCFLLYLLLLKFNYNKKISLLSGIIFAVHPLFTHSVVWIPSRGDLLLFLFGLLSFLSFINYLNTKNIKYLIIHFLVFFLGMLSKENAIVLPVIFLFYYFLIYRKRSNINQLILSVIAWIVPILIWYYFRQIAMVDSVGEGTLGIKSVIYNIPMIPEIISKFFIPINLSVLPTFDIIRTISGILILLVTTYFIIVNKSKSSNIYIGLLWFIFMILPVLAFKLPNAESYYDYLDHRAYLPIIGIIIILIEIIPKTWQNFSNKKFQYVSYCLIGIFFVLTLFQSRNYLNPITYWNNGIKHNETRAMFRYGLGLAYKIQKDTENSRKEFLKSIELDPKLGESYLELGEIYYNSNDYQNAVKYFKTGKELNPKSNLADINLAVAYGCLGQTDEAIKQLKDVLAHNQNDKDALYNLVISYKMKMDFDSALIYAKKLEKFGEVIDYAELYTTWGVYYQQKGNLNKAIEQTKKALDINSNYPPAFSKLGFYYLLTGNKALGDSYLKKALSLKPNYLDVYNNYFTYYYSFAKDYKQAVIYADLIVKNGGQIDKNVLNILSKYR